MYAVWDEWTGSAWEVHVAFKPRGGAWSGKFRIAPGLDPTIAATQAPIAYVAWSDDDIFGTSLSLGMVRFPPTRLDDDASGSPQWFPSAAMNGTGKLLVVWEDHRGGVARIYGITATLPFLDLPIQYTNFSVAANGNIGGNNPGRVNLWFDHQYPTYNSPPNNQYPGLLRWDGRFFPNPTNIGEGWYDGHSGIDFQRKQTNEQVFAAANGTVFGVVNNCGGCTTGYGNRVWINHGNGYATLYGHLNIVSVTNGTVITDRIAQPLGRMGSTGYATGTHLHFGLYYDQNGDDQWSESEAVDPYGWQGATNDPWSVPSRYLWIHPLSARQQINNSGGSVSAPSGNSAVTVPAGAVVSPVTLELWDTPPVAGASATLRSTGNSFWMRVLEWLTGGSSPSLMASASTNSFDVPVTVTANFDSASMPHLDTSQLTINQWDEAGQAWVALLPTTLDTVNQQASAQTSQPGNFDLQAPLVCPADTLEPNDNYDGASVVQTDGTLVSNLFDIAQDEDWFKFDATAGTEYAIQTTNLTAGVDTALEIYDTNGVTLLASDNNGGGGKASRLVWQAPQSGTYFLRVSQAAGSAYGCSATYQISANQVYSIFLPMILR
ncbi:MAG: peptidoglycan DD-metalloendopeptidase family protein [Chloroflexota bacterium]